MGAKVPLFAILKLRIQECGYGTFNPQVGAKMPIVSILVLKKDVGGSGTFNPQLGGVVQLFSILELNAVMELSILQWEHLCNLFQSLS